MCVNVHEMAMAMAMANWVAYMRNLFLLSLNKLVTRCGPN